MDNPVLELEEILGPRDEQLLRKLSAHEPAILDDVTNYHLSRVGCATTDKAATRLLSVAVQVAFEKAIDEAKLIHASSKARLTASMNRPEGSGGTAQRGSQRRSGRSEEASATSSGTASAADEMKELYLDSLCKALQRNGTLPVGPSFDLLLQPLGQGPDSVGS
ncbi:hypothetical protein Esti_006178 [Eimeria stiedai]